MFCKVIFRKGRGLRNDCEKRLTPTFPTRFASNGVGSVESAVGGEASSVEARLEGLVMRVMYF